jgi:hypothetical protein
MVNEAPTELALINFLIIVLIFVDAYIRIRAAKPNSSDTG